MRAAGWAIVAIGLGFGCGSAPQVPENTAGKAAVPGGGVIAGAPARPAAAGVGATGGTPTQGPNPAPAGHDGTAGRAGVPAAVSGGGPASVNVAGMASVATEKFSFFVTSLGGMQKLSKSDQGFGGDLRYGEATGLAGADKICSELAESSMPGAGAKGWRAFLSTAKGGPSDGPQHARDRIGKGPWYDRTGRLVAMTLTDLLMQRPAGADSAIAEDLPNENGVPNHRDTMSGADDNHDTVTGSNAMGMYGDTPTCSDWTSVETAGAAGSAGAGGRGGGRGGMSSGRSAGPQVGHSWSSQQSGVSWIMTHQAPGCAPSVALMQTGAGSGVGIGNGGGYGGIYCFALMP